MLPRKQRWSIGLVAGQDLEGITLFPHEHDLPILKRLLRPVQRYTVWRSILLVSARNHSPLDGC